MKNVFLKGIFILFSCGALLACSAKPTESEIAAPAPPKKNEPTISIESKQLAVEQNAKSVMEIKFNKNKTQLTEENKKNIKALLKEIAANPNAKKIAVVTWADAEYPSEDKKELSDGQKKIAEDRNQVIKSFIEKTLSKKLEIVAYNMAERPTAFNEFIKSPEARIKKSLEVAGIPTTETAAQFPRKASKSIILAITE